MMTKRDATPSTRLLGSLSPPAIRLRSRRELTVDARCPERGAAPHESYQIIDLDLGTTPAIGSDREKHARYPVAARRDARDRARGSGLQQARAPRERRTGDAPRSAGDQAGEPGP